MSDVDPSPPGRRSVILAAAGVLAACTAPPTTPPPSSVAASTSTPAPATSTPAPANQAPATSRGTTPVLATAGPDVIAGDRTLRQVALTFHGAGDPAITRDVLDLLARRDTRVSVLAVGDWLSAHLDLGRRIRDVGHDLGNHTWSHQTMPRLAPAAMAPEIARCAEVVATVLGTPGPLFRPSGTQYSTEAIRTAARAAGYQRCLSYDLDPLDYADPGPDAIVAATAEGLHPGAIVSLHLGHRGTVLALPRILDAVAAAGLAAVPTSVLLSTGTPVLATT